MCLSPATFVQTLGADEIDDALIEPARRLAGSKTEDGRACQLVVEYREEAFRELFIEEIERIVADHPAWLGEKQAGESQPMLLADRQLHVPPLRSVERLGQVVEADAGQRRRERRVSFVGWE